MDKKAEMDEKDRRMLGAGLAGVGAALIGGGVIPGLVYKKPTWYSRLLMGGASGALTALAVAAALNKQKAPNTPAEDVGKNISSVGQNAFNILFPGPMSATEQRQMGPWARALAGKGDSFPALMSRVIGRSIPDFQGWLGKSDYVKYKEKTGELPKYEYPNQGTRIGFDLFNLAAGTGAGIWNFKRLNRNYAEKKIADTLTQFAPSMGDMVTDKKLLKRLTDLQSNMRRGWHWKDLFKRKTKGSQQLLVDLQKHLRNDTSKGGIAEKLRYFNAKPSLKRKFLHGGKSVLLGLLVSGILGNAESLIGLKDSRYLDSNVDLLKDLQHAAR